MGYKMDGAPMMANTKSHGTNKNFGMSGVKNADGSKKSGAPAFLDNLMKGKGALGALNPLGAIGSRLGLFGKNKGGGQPSPPVAPVAGVPPAAPVSAQGEQPIQ